MTISEPLHAGAFLVSDVGSLSYEVGTVADGQTLEAGEAVMLSGGKLVTWNGGTDTNCIGFILYPINADGDTKATYLARLAEVREADITFPDGTRSILLADLALINIVLR